MSPSRVDGGTYEKNFIGNVTSSICANNVDCAFVDLHRRKPRRYMLGDEKGTVVRQKSRASVRDKYRYIGLVSEEKKAKGTIGFTNWSGKVDFRDGRPHVRFKQQIRLSKPAKPGDSGSLLLNGKNEAIGLVFATVGKYGLANPIHKVLKTLEADIAEIKHTTHTMKLRSHSRTEASTHAMTLRSHRKK